MAWTTEYWHQDDAVFYGYPIPADTGAPEVSDKSRIPSKWLFDNTFYHYPHIASAPEVSDKSKLPIKWLFDNDFYGYPHVYEFDIPVEWIEPTIDRNISDIKNAIKNMNKKKTNPSIEFEFTKAYLNYTDLNRIENNTKYLSKKLKANIIAKMDWSADKIPFISDRTRILQNMNDIRSIFLETYPEIELETVPTKLSTYADFNQLENVQLQIYETISEGGE